MLSKPYYGWSDFQLDGISKYELSYLDDIAFEWVTQAIHGLETLMPFCVKGFLEPKRFICTVSYWNCHIVCEDEERYLLKKDEIINEISHTNMLQFCQDLYDDISQNIDEWTWFAPHGDEANGVELKESLVQKLEQLKELISKREDCFDNHHCFL